jgi:hypothetical protein
MAITKEERLAKIHADAVAEFNTIQTTMRDERTQCLQDRRFYSIAGAQWEGGLGEQFDNKPKFEVNKIHLSVIRIFNEYRNNRISVTFVPKAGAKDDKLADVCAGLYRADEQDSCAEEAYDNAFEEAVGGGYGAWRLRTEYEDEEDDENEKQRIRFEPIFDADSSVYFDLNAKRQDKSDAKRCYVLTAWSPDAYKNEYGDNPASWPKTVHQHEFDWATPNVVYVAELYEVELKKEIVFIWEGMNGEEERYTSEDFEDDPELRGTLLATGFKEVRQKKVKRKRIHKYVMDGLKIREDCGYIAGSCIPIVVMYGKRWFVDNVERCMGHVRLAKDTQRLGNMQRSKLGELAALSSVEKPIFTPEQMAGHGTMWSEDNVKNYPYLLVNAVTNPDGQSAIMGPVAYTKPPQIPPAMAALLSFTEQDMKDLLGNQEQAEAMQPNMSGIAVELIQNRLDMQTFIYMSNMAKAIRRSGEIWLGMARDIFVEPERVMKSIGAQGEVDEIQLLTKKVVDGEQKTENDISRARFDVSVEVGPTSASKRAATVRALTSMASITDDPETKQVLGAMAMMNMEGEGISDVRDYFRNRLIRMGALKPTEDEAKALAQEQANQPPDPNAQYLQKAAEAEEAKAALSRANVVDTLVAAEKKQAETAKILSEIEDSDARLALEGIDRIQKMKQGE